MSRIYSGVCHSQRRRRRGLHVVLRAGGRRCRVMQGGRVAHCEAGLRRRAGHTVPLEFAAKALQQDGRAQRIVRGADAVAVADMSHVAGYPGESKTQYGTRFKPAFGRVSAFTLS